MRYLSTFAINVQHLRNPNIYPFSVFHDRFPQPFCFEPITVFYGNNGCGKSTLLNIIADRLQIQGGEHAIPQSYGMVDYWMEFVNGCSYSCGEGEEGRLIQIPETSRYIKSEDIMYEIKKVQQRKLMEEGRVYDLMKQGMTFQQAEAFNSSSKGFQARENIAFSCEKYSNGETAMDYYENFLNPDGLYLLDEPEVSLSPQNQVKLAEKFNEMTRLLGCQFIIATHSPFILGTMHAKIYDLDTRDMDTKEWFRLENVRYFYDFFMKHRNEFEDR